MGMVVNPYSHGPGVNSLGAFASTTVFPATTHTPANNVWADLLNGNGGAPVAVTITKGAGTNILVAASAALNMTSGTVDASIGVHDGTNDHIITRTQLGSAVQAPQRTIQGHILLTGLPAGTYTFTLRTLSATYNFSNTCSASLSVEEVL